MKKWIICAGSFPDEKFIRCAEDNSEKNDLADVSGIAYSGGPLSQWWSSTKLVFDLAGMEIAPQLPLLYNHCNDPEYRLGQISAAIDGKTIKISGGVDKATERGKFIVEAGKKFQWQLSIGAEILAMEDVSPEDTRTINGREFAGPFIHVKKSHLREVSVCAVGADPEASMRIAASLNINPVLAKTNHQQEEKNMNENFKKFLRLKYKLGEADEAAIKAHLAKIGSTLEAEEAEFNKKATEPAAPETKPAPVQAAAPQPAPASVSDERIAAIVARQLAAKEQAENDRKAGIVAACGEDFATFAAEAINSGYSVQETTRIVAALKAHATKTPTAGVNIISANQPEINAKVLEAALCFNQGIDEKTITASFSDQVVEAGNKYRGITLKELLRFCARMEGKTISPTFDNYTIAAAFSTVSLPGILGNVANKKLLQAFNAQPIIATRLCRAGDLADFKESERYRLTDVGDLEIVPDGGEIKHGSVSEEKAVNQLSTYGKMFVLTRQMIYNDDLGAFLAIPEGMGQRAARKIDQLFHARLLSNPTFTDGAALFSATHGNYTTGTTGALSLDSLKAARNKFLLAKDSDGNPINVLPKFLFVPSCLDSLANELVISPTVVGGSTATPAFNVLSKYGLEVVSSPYLQIGVGGQAGSSTGWYLFGDPAQIDTFEIGYLQGRRVPVVEQGAVDFNTLGIAFRVVYDLGVREQAYQGMTFNTGVVA